MSGRTALLVGHATSHEALAAARDLAGGGWDVHVATGSRRSLAGASRAVRGEHRVTAPDVDLTAFTADVAGAVRASGAEVVVGCGDPELLALSAVREQVPAHVPLADHASVVSAVDKVGLAEATERSGMATPRTVLADDAGLAAWRGAGVVKPRLHWHPGLSGTPSWAGAQLVDDAAGAAGAAGDIRRAGREPVLQELVVGELIAIFAVRARSGAVLALGQQRATRTWPLGAGVSSRAETVPVDADLAAGVLRLLDELGWVGMAQVQLLDAGDGRPRVLDLNGRPYGSLPLAAAAGLSLVSLWLGSESPGPSTASERPAPGADRDREPLFAAVGARYSRTGPDLRRAATERRGGLAADLRESLVAWWGAAHPVADRTDPLPLARLAAQSATSTARSLVQGGRAL